MGDVQREGNRSYGNLSPKNKEHYKEIARRINAQEGGPPDAIVKTTISNIRTKEEEKAVYLPACWNKTTKHCFMSHVPSFVIHMPHDEVADHVLRDEAADHVLHDKATDHVLHDEAADHVLQDEVPYSPVMTRQLRCRKKKKRVTFLMK
ncbi:hypothetical protein OS493_006190 [Desmophyllum pertusum]|uniref:Uncharacterized protein n=1 Tax=Desmophyllum pertusum TaxID=174260 RepID=A0A9X0DB66_9CNID|nr:hypothetical protein OS493_006190 [Desmophyllum pertusum]